MPEDYPIRLVRPFESMIQVLRLTLLRESQLGILYTRDEMFAEAMRVSEGRCNPKQVKEFTDRICDERGYK